MNEPMKSRDPNEPTGGDPRNRSVRLVFEYEGTEIKLISHQRVAMVPNPPHALVPRHDERGFWLVLADADEHPLYRRVIDNPIRHDIEVVADDPHYPLTRVKVEKPHGRFFVVVPDIPAARSVALFGHAAAPGAKPTAVKQLHRFDLPHASQEGRHDG